jgi:hypothetical protein
MPPFWSVRIQNDEANPCCRSLMWNVRNLVMRECRHGSRGTRWCGHLSCVSAGADPEVPGGAGSCHAWVQARIQRYQVVRALVMRECRRGSRGTRWCGLLSCVSAGADPEVPGGAVSCDAWVQARIQRYQGVSRLCRHILFLPMIFRTIGAIRYPEVGLPYFVYF